MTPAHILTGLAVWTLLSLAIGGVFGWLNYRRHLHSTHNPSRQDGEGKRERSIYQHAAGSTAKPGA